MTQAADLAVLRELIHTLAVRPEIRRQVIEFLQDRVKQNAQQKTGARGEIALAIWDELEPDLAELDQYGGGSREQEKRVGKLLYQIVQTLEEGPISEDDRGQLLDEVIPFIRSRSSGMEDLLYRVAYAACRTADGLREFAERLEELGQDWPLDHARRIYRRIGDTEKYLALRMRRMELGADYCGLKS